MWADTLLIVGISVFTALLGEGTSIIHNLNSWIQRIWFIGVTWLLVYKTEKYIRLKSEIERQSKKRNVLSSHFLWRHQTILSIDPPILVEKIKDTYSDTLDKQHRKKIDREEEKLKNNNRDLSLVKMKSMLAIGFAFTALLGMFNSMQVWFWFHLFLMYNQFYVLFQFRWEDSGQATVHSDIVGTGSFAPQPAWGWLHRLLLHLPLHFVMQDTNHSTRSKL